MEGAREYIVARLNDLQNALVVAHAEADVLGREAELAQERANAREQRIGEIEVAIVELRTLAKELGIEIEPPTAGAGDAPPPAQ